ncbi:hypothetical protein [Pseudomonas sp. PSKL.D1]|uniref:hypothetical protein n=1 Tax=Pseudomonas sp. PSKL.D1 TaxID=3029060 RepID=UPI002380F606|nr:hypothetical protein [Pseudomonas sp. PSKL.D1]WDY56807.1 hypothetical protein PVV54_19805 [Pseudomonas sp. PSKL.D1]
MQNIVIPIAGNAAFAAECGECGLPAMRLAADSRLCGTNGRSLLQGSGKGSRNVHVFRLCPTSERPAKNADSAPQNGGFYQAASAFNAIC